MSYEGITDIWSALGKITIKHVAVGLRTFKHAPKEDLTGALIGLRPISGLTDLANPKADFIWIAAGEKFERLEILNLEDYEIIEIHIGAIQNGEPIEISSQASHILNLERCRLVLGSIGQTQKDLLDGDSGLVDASRFNDWTPIIKSRISKNRLGKRESKTIDEIFEKKPEIPFSRSGAKTVQEDNYACAYGCYTVASKKVTTKSFKRSTKYPIGAAIEAMKKKLAAIKSKAYTPDNPFRIEVKDENKDKPESSTKVSVGDHVRIVAGEWVGWEGRLVSVFYALSGKSRRVTVEMPKGNKIDMEESCVAAISTAEEAAGIEGSGLQRYWPTDDGCLG